MAKKKLSRNERIFNGLSELFTREPLAQAFIFNALSKEAEFVVEHFKNNPQALRDPSSIVNPKAWLIIASAIEEILQSE